MKDLDSTYAEYERLVYKKFNIGLNNAEEVRLSQVQVLIDELENTCYGHSLDNLEAVADAAVALAKQIDVIAKLTKQRSLTAEEDQAVNDYLLSISELGSLNQF